MPTLRKSLLPATSLALVSAAAIAVFVDAARAQEGAPVRYGTDPGYAGEMPQVLSYRDEDAPEPVGEIRHTVRAGETVYALARLYDVSPGAIIEKNGLDAPYGLQIGQPVMIPVAPDEPLRPATGAIRAAAPTYDTARAPVTNSAAARRGGDRMYTVQPGDTLYSLSRRFGLSVGDIAAANNLGKPYTISVDQTLRIPGAGDSPYATSPRPVIARAATRRSPDPDALERMVVSKTMAPEVLPELDASSPFAWPVRGPVLVQFGETRSGEKSDGINIAAPIGAPVRAAADGEVVYRGNELDGYGNLLLVKHSDGWVSAYAHTDAILVRRGDMVRRGQVIAKVGRSGSVDRPQLHFQLRKDLEPLDPLVAMNGNLSGAGITAAGLNN